MNLKDKLQGRAPKTAIILGSALGSVVDAVDDPADYSVCGAFGFSRAENFGPCRKTLCGQRLVAKKWPCLAGRAHPYESGNAGVMRPALDQLKAAGIETLVLTNAAGSLKASMKPGSLMVLTDHINCAGMNPLIGQHGDENFVSMTNAYDADLRKAIAGRREEGKDRAEAGCLLLVFRPVI